MFEIGRNYVESTTRKELSQGNKIYGTPLDGNCFFNSIIRGGLNQFGINTVEDARALVVDYLTHRMYDGNTSSLNKEKCFSQPPGCVTFQQQAEILYGDFFDEVQQTKKDTTNSLINKRLNRDREIMNMFMTKHLVKMKNTKEWATELEVTLLNEILRKIANVSIYRKEGKEILFYNAYDIDPRLPTIRLISSFQKRNTKEEVEQWDKNEGEILKAMREALKKLKQAKKTGEVNELQSQINELESNEPSLEDTGHYEYLEMLPPHPDFAEFAIAPK
jgi:hypothetical protein